MIVRLTLALALLALISPTAEARRVRPLSEEGYKTARPTLGPAGRGQEAIAAWDEGQGDRVVSRVVGAGGRPLSLERELTVAGDNDQVLAPAAAGTRAGYLVAWVRSPHAVEAVVLDRDGEAVASVDTIATDDVHLERPYVVYHPQTREYLVVWLDDDGAGLDSTEALFARRLDRRGEPLGPAVMVSPRYMNVTSYAVAARRDRRGYLVAWNRNGPDGVGIEARALDGLAMPAGPVRAIGPGDDSVALAWSGRKQTFVLATHDYRVRLYRVDPNGARRGRAHTVRPGPTDEQAPSDVVLAYERGSDTLLVVWREGEAAGDPLFTPGLQARRLRAADFETLGSPRVPSRTSSTFYDLCCPAVAAFRGDGYLVTWAGGRGDGTGSKIFAQGL